MLINNAYTNTGIFLLKKKYKSNMSTVTKKEALIYKEVEEPDFWSQSC